VRLLVERPETTHEGAGNVRTTTTNDRWNPFSWRAAELATLNPGPEHEARRADLRADLALAEAEEVARGGRHLSVVHGDPSTVEEAQHVAEFYDVVREMASRVEWSRLRGAEDHVIVAVAGDSADECVTRLANIATSMNPGFWRITRSACPDLG
jgi:hypothetical protein